MAALSDYTEAQIANHMFRSDTFSKPSMLAIALLGAPAVDADTGNFGGKEVGSSGAYVRYTIGPPGNVHFNAPTVGGLIDNTSGFTWPQATRDWGWISGIAIVDSFGWGSGNVLMHGSLTTPKFIASGDTFRIQQGDLDITLA